MYEIFHTDICKLPHPFYYFRSCKFSSFILNRKKGVCMRGFTEKHTSLSFWKWREERRWMVHKTEHDHGRRLNLNYFLFTTHYNNNSNYIRPPKSASAFPKSWSRIILYSSSCFHEQLLKLWTCVCRKNIKQFELHIFADLLSTRKKCYRVHIKEKLWVVKSLKSF